MMVFCSIELPDDDQFIEWIINLKGNEYLAAVDEQYIADEFNLKGLEKYTTNLKSVTNYIIGVESDGRYFNQQC